jgi:hypothetical protein
MLDTMTDATDPTGTAEPASFDAATELGNDLRRRTAAVRGNPHLSAVERGQALADLATEHERRLEQVKVADRIEQATTAAARWVAAFGTLDQDHAQRANADARAMQLGSPDEALAALDRAQLLGDETMARAVAEHAFNAVRSSPLAAIRLGPWGAVLDRFRSTRPEADAALAQLLPTGTNPRHDAMARRMGIELRATTEASR